MEDTMTDKNEGQLFERLMEIVAILRAPDGCPWDREQTQNSIVPYLIEEAHEVVEAIEQDDSEQLCEELGDLLLEVALLAQMAKEKGDFTVADSLQSICDKMVRRHPHIFADEVAEDALTVKRNWSRIKAEEKPDRTTLDGVPRSLGALHRARRVAEKAANVGFDWEGVDGVVDKVKEEWGELSEALENRDQKGAEEELGDLLFVLACLGRHLKIDAERSLHSTVDKFMRRFSHIETELEKNGQNPADATMDEMEALWQEAKGIERE
jgi:MazG family protein